MEISSMIKTYKANKTHIKYNCRTISRQKVGAYIYNQALKIKSIFYR